MKNANIIKIIRYYKQADFEGISEYKIFECIHCINPNLFADMEILRKWEAFFQGLNVPYCITEQPYKNQIMLSLWKERYV